MTATSQRSHLASICCNTCPAHRHRHSAKDTGTTNLATPSCRSETPLLPYRDTSVSTSSPPLYPTRMLTARGHSRAPMEMSALRSARKVRTSICNRGLSMALSSQSCSVKPLRHRLTEKDSPRVLRHETPLSQRAAPKAVRILSCCDAVMPATYSCVRACVCVCERE